MSEFALLCVLFPFFLGPAHRPSQSDKEQGHEWYPLALPKAAAQQTADDSGLDLLNSSVWHMISWARSSMQMVLLAQTGFLRPDKVNRSRDTLKHSGKCRARNVVWQKAATVVCGVSSFASVQDDLDAQPGDFFPATPSSVIAQAAAVNATCPCVSRISTEGVIRLGDICSVSSRPPCMQPVMHGGKAKPMCAGGKSPLHGLGARRTQFCTPTLGLRCGGGLL